LGKSGLDVEFSYDPYNDIHLWDLLLVSLLVFMTSGCHNKGGYSDINFIGFYQVSLYWFVNLEQNWKYDKELVKDFLVQYTVVYWTVMLLWLVICISWPSSLDLIVSYSLTWFLEFSHQRKIFWFSWQTFWSASNPPMTWRHSTYSV